MKNKCLYCYKEVDGDKDFHKKCSKQFFGTISPPKIDYTYSQMSELAKKVVERSVSVPGVQSKLSISVIKEKTISRLTVVGALGGNYIFKPPSDEFDSMPENEHLTMRLAELFGIKTVSSSLIKLKSGELSYITKRIDRTDKGEKIHMIDMFQILEAYDKYKSSMEKVGKALGKYSSNPLLDKVSLFELTLFCFLVGNNDMHLKNFSMIDTIDGWIIAPFYDLLNVNIVLKEDKEESALSIDGRKRKLTKGNFISFGENLGLNERQIKGVFNSFKKRKDKGIELVKKSFLTKNLKKNYLVLLDERYNILNEGSTSELNSKGYNEIKDLYKLHLQEQKNKLWVSAEKYYSAKENELIQIPIKEREEYLIRKIAKKNIDIRHLHNLDSFDEIEKLKIEKNELEALLENYKGIAEELPPSCACFHMSYSGKNIVAFTDMFVELKKNLIASDTEKKSFFTIFDNNIENQKVNWKADKNQLTYFIKELVKSPDITFSKKWITTANCFLLDGKELTHKELHNQGNPSDSHKLKQVDDAIQKLNITKEK